ncbi:MAG TPA: DNA topoisomerase I, partial [Desulfurococcales archaeon]|nr:DNA topoisomerase I [Desulfurococcales archaeon]
MEQVNIGTEGTRARIIETLFSRRYLEVKAGKVEVTKIGYCIAEVLSTFFKELTSVELTRKFEEYINNIRFNRVKRESVLNEAKKTIDKLIENFKKSLYDIGVILSKSLNIIPVNRKCIICDNEAVVDKPALCKYHLLAYEKLIKHYWIWRKAFESLDWINYLKKIIRLKSSCGKWVREVAQAIYERKIDVDLSSIMLNNQ